MQFFYIKKIQTTRNLLGQISIIGEVARKLDQGFWIKTNIFSLKNTKRHSYNKKKKPNSSFLKT